MAFKIRILSGEKMKSLYEINGELDKFIKLKNNRLFDFPPFNRITLTIEEITNSVILLYEIRETIQNNTIEDAKYILSKRREKVIQQIECLSQKPDTRHNCTILESLDDELKCLNWVLDRNEFDKEID